MSSRWAARQAATCVYVWPPEAPARTARAHSDGATPAASAAAPCQGRGCGDRWTVCAPSDTDYFEDGSAQVLPVEWHVRRNGSGLPVAGRGARGAAAAAVAFLPAHRLLRLLAVEPGLLHAPAAHGGGEGLEDADRVLPTDAAVGDALAVGELLARHEVLTARHEVALDHDSEDALVAPADLLADVLADGDLVLRLLLAVGVARVDHEPLRESRLGDLLARRLDAAGVVVGRLPAAQDDVAVLVPAGGDDGGVPTLRDGQEMVRLLRRLDRVDRDPDVAVGAVLETDRTGEARRGPAVDLALRRARADGAPRDEVRDVLRRDHVEVLAPRRQAQLVDVEEELAREPQAAVDGEAAVEAGVVDEPLPPHRRARLLEVDPHHDLEVGAEALPLLQQAGGVVLGRAHVVDGAGADHDHQAVVHPVEHPVDALARVVDGGGGLLGAGK